MKKSKYYEALETETNQQFIIIDRNNNVDVSADTNKLKDLLLNVKYNKY